jgi:hypothetical protein
MRISQENPPGAAWGHRGSVIIAVHPSSAGSGRSSGPGLVLVTNGPIVQQGIHAVDTRSRPARTGLPRLAVWLLMGLIIAAAVATAGLVDVALSHRTPATASARTRTAFPPAAEVSGTPVQVSIGAARALLTAAPDVVVANDASRADVLTAAAIAVRLHAPLLLAAVPGLPQQGTSLRTEVKALSSGTAVAIGIPDRTAAAELGIRVVASARGLPATGAAVPLRHVALLVHGTTSVSAIAATATATVAGARVITVSGYDPRADPAAIKALTADRPASVLAIGAKFRSVPVLAARVAVAETGVQLPGGGQVLFPMRKIVALYGNPESSALGALGQQGLAASITRAQRVAAQYNALTKVPVVPAFEIIATVAQGSPGPSGSYSYETPVADLRPYVNAATAAHMYVILDLQPGRDNLLTQARLYKSLLRQPNVGLALDPEWKLQPGQKPLQQIGSVSITEVNSVVNWLAALTARYHLPQKLLELHQFRLSMIQGEAQLNTRNDDLAIVVNMDGQGAPGTKQQTWDGIVSAAPKGVFFGWKDFYVKDTPMIGPRATIGHKPSPVLISYQ